MRAWRHYGLPYPPQLVDAWRRRGPPLGRGRPAGSGYATMRGTRGSARAARGDRRPRRPDFPGRVAAVEENLQRLWRRVSDSETTLQRVSTSTCEDLAREASARAAGDERIRDYFTGAGAGGLPLSAVGMAWVVVGMLMSWSAAGLVRLFRPILPYESARSLLSVEGLLTTAVLPRCACASRQRRRYWLRRLRASRGDTSASATLPHAARMLATWC